jgi:uncharacterized membrane protein
LSVGLHILGYIPILGHILWVIGGILVFVFWLLSFIWSIQGEMKPIPWVGETFQSWFRGM